MNDPVPFSHGSVRDLFGGLASSDAPQDIVTAAGVAAGMGASLLILLATLPKTKSDSLADRRALAAAATALSDIQQQLLEAIDTETAVKVFTARRMPHGTEKERATREAAVQLALRAAAEVPLEVMRLATHALVQAQEIAEHGTRAGFVELEMAVSLIRVGLEGARSALESKLTSLSDVVYTERVIDEVARLSDEAAQAWRVIERVLKAPSA